MTGLSTALRNLPATPEPPELGPAQRPGTLSVAEIDTQLKALSGKFPRTSQQLIRATLYLWHDHLDPSHSIAQGIETADGSLLHGIMHRREPDFSNARYWFRRVGAAHPSFECVAGKVKIAVKGRDAGAITKKLMPNEKWHPLAFVDLIEDAQRREDAAFDQLLRE